MRIIAADDEALMLSTANLIICGVVATSPGTLSESVGINGFLTEKLGHIFVGALLVTAEI